MTATEFRENLRRDLEAKGIEAARAIDRERQVDATRRALEIAPTLLWAVPLALLFGVLARRANGNESAFISLLVAIALTLVLPLGYVLWKRFQVTRNASSSRAGLAEIDKKCELEDRLGTARDFLEDASEGSFVEASLHDAHEHLDRADRIPLGQGAADLHLETPAILSVAGAFAVLLLAWWIGGGAVISNQAETAVPDDKASAQVAKVDEAKASQEIVPDPLVDQKENVIAERPPRRPGDDQPASAARANASLASEMKKTRGQTGFGKATDAASASGASEAKGEPSGQAQEGKSAKKPTKKKKKKTKPSKPKKSPRKPTKSEDKAGATAGRGAASGSNRSPAASSWKSKDQVVSDDDDDLEDDEDVDDEFDDDDARGGLQPQLRDRKPPVNRDLGIGFGNNKNPDANGRGGPSEQKKSRGVAALVLGVSIPDHIKGKPSPGKTKVTQERIEPREDESQRLGAQKRGKASENAARHARAPLEPWMRNLLRSWFKERRAEDAKKEKINERTRP